MFREYLHKNLIAEWDRSRFIRVNLRLSPVRWNRTNYNILFVANYKGQETLTTNGHCPRIFQQSVLRLAHDRSREDCLLSLCDDVSLRDIDDRFEAPLLFSPRQIRVSGVIHLEQCSPTAAGNDQPRYCVLSPRHSSRAESPYVIGARVGHMCEHAHVHVHVHETWSRWRIVSRHATPRHAASSWMHSTLYATTVYNRTCVVYLYGYTNGGDLLHGPHGFQRRGRFTPRCASSPGIRVQCHVGNDTIGHAPIRVP